MSLANMVGASLISRKGEESKMRCVMLSLDSINPEKWYSVKEVAAILGFSEDTVIRQINRGFIRAFVLPCKSPLRRRSYYCRRILGRDLIRYIDGHMNPN